MFMIYGLESLTDEEAEILLEAPVLITILIGDADHDIDHYEEEWGAKIAKFRSVKGDKNVQDYYRNLEPVFADKLQVKLDAYNEVALSNQYIIDKVSENLQKLNPILRKLPRQEAISLYESFKSFAMHIAKASGGFLHMGSITPTKQKLLNLPMLENPAEAHPESENE